MPDILFATGNSSKFFGAQQVCQPLGISLIQKQIDLLEIQGHDGQAIARHKAAQAFQILQKPLVITDDSWFIPGLNGFPGPYMHDMNTWLSVEDWLNLTRPLKDRRVTLRQICVYKDAAIEQLFTSDTDGVLLSDAQGEPGTPHGVIVSFDGGNRSIAEVRAAGQSPLAGKPTVWHDFAQWYTDQHDR